MPRPRRIWWKASHSCWYVKHQGKLIRLDPDPEKARAMWNIIVQAGSSQAIATSTRNGCASVAPSLRVDQLVDLYLADARTRMRLSTVECLKWSLGHFRAALGSLPGSALRGHHVLGWVRSRDWGPTGQHTYAGHVRMLMRWACDTGLIPAYHLGRLRLPTANRTECVSEDVVQRFEAAITSQAIRDIWRVGLACGGRPGELRSLMAIRISADRRQGEVTGKRGKRPVWFAAWIIQDLDRLCRERPSGPLLLSPGGIGWTRYTHEQHFRNVSARARVDVSPKQSRKVFYSRLIAAGVSPVVVARLMGHSTVQMGYSHYSGFEADTLNDAVDRA